MSEFCTECPLKGECSGEIEFIGGGDFGHTRLNMGLIPKWQDNYASIAEAVDENGGRSELFMGVDAETIQERLDGCKGPTDKQRKSSIPFVKPKIYRVCGALGIGPNVPPWYEEHYRSESARIHSEHENE